LANGLAHGNIGIPDSLATGWYTLRVFTTWMLNFEKGSIFSQRIYIKSAHDKVNVVDSNKNKSQKYQIYFFPEGGSLTDGNICNIGFKAVDENGQPVKISGDVSDGSNTSLAKLITIHDGMGSFELETFANKRYTARVYLPDNSIQNILLPKVEKTGVSLRVNASSADEFNLKIAYSGQEQEYHDILVEAVQNSGLIASYPLKLSRGVNIFGFKKNTFSTGILRLTVFDDTGLPLAERLVFINNNDQLNATVTADTLSAKPGGKNVFALQVTDVDGHPGKANISMAITDANLDSESDENVFSYFLMTSELRGHIHDPGYYFKNNSDSLQQQLDLVMLTNGWRRFKSNAIPGNKQQVFKYAVEKSQFISGKVENYLPKDNLKLKLIITTGDSEKVLVSAGPDSTGVFKIDGYDHEGKAKIYYEAVNAKNVKTPVKVIFFNRDLDTMNFGADTSVAFVDTMSLVKNSFDMEAIKPQNGFSAKGITLKSVNTKEHLLSQTELLIQNHVGQFNTINAQTLDLVNEGPIPNGNVIDYITGRFPGLKIIPQNSGDFIFQYHGAHELPNSGGDQTDKPFFYIDEELSDINEVNDIPLSDVALIQFVPPPVSFAPLNGGFSGAILIYIKKNKDGINSFKPKSYSHLAQFDQYTFNGYSITREFSSNDFSFKDQTARSGFCPTFYWEHDAITDDKGNIKISFYSPATVKKFRVIIQGMDDNGKLVYLCKTF
jgi:hypothetical protein